MSIIHQRPHSGRTRHNDFWPQKVNMLMGIQLSLDNSLSTLRSLGRLKLEFSDQEQDKNPMMQCVKKVSYYVNMKYYTQWTQSDKNRNLTTAKGKAPPPTPRKNHSVSICARAWEYFDHTSVHSVCSLASCCAWVSYRGEDQARWWVLVGGEAPHVVSLHSDKLCSVDMPPALNKPVAAPRVEPIAQRAVGRRVRRRIKWVKRFLQGIRNKSLFVVLVAHCALSHILSWAPCWPLYSFFFFFLTHCT